MKHYDVVIIGGGLAGLSAAIHLAKFQLHVLVFERHTYPRHKVCGEYVSNEVIPYLAYLAVDLPSLHLPAITQFEITSLHGKKITSTLPLGGFGISRYAFDQLLYEKAKNLGVEFIFEKVDAAVFQDDRYVVTTSHTAIKASVVLGGFGKRSNLDWKLKRDFIEKPALWIGVKAHYAHPDFPSNKVALHNFEGGYAGLSLTETGHVNVCYLANYEIFKKYKNIQEFTEQVLYKNTHLATFLESASLQFENHLAIAQVSFETKKTVENGILMLGDAAGLIHPLCGNGMAMAIHSAKLAAEEVIAFQAHGSREQLMENYTQKWKHVFQKRMTFGRIFQHVLMRERYTNLGITLGSNFPWMVKKMIEQTHGKPIQCD